MIAISVSLVGRLGRLRAGLDWAATQRVTGVELDSRRQVIPSELGSTARRQLRHLINERSLKLSALQFPLRGGLADLDRLADRVDAIKQSMALGYELGTTSINVPFTCPVDEASRIRTAEVLAEVALFGDRTGCRIMLRTGGEADDVADLLQQADCVDLIDVQLDPAGCLSTNESLESAFSRLGDAIRQVRIIDAIRAARGLGRETTIGRGEVDFDMLAALASQGPVNFAVISPDDPTNVSLEDGIAFGKAVFGLSAD